MAQTCTARLDLEYEEYAGLPLPRPPLMIIALLDCEIMNGGGVEMGAK